MLEIDGYSPQSIRKTNGTRLVNNVTNTFSKENQSNTFRKVTSNTTTTVDYSFLVSCTASDSADIVVISNIY